MIICLIRGTGQVKGWVMRIGQTPCHLFQKDEVTGKKGKKTGETNPGRMAPVLGRDTHITQGRMNGMY